MYIPKVVPNRILIDAVSNLETRIVIIDDNNRIISFEQEMYYTTYKARKGSIYLAKVSKIEHSLHAIFIEYAKDEYGFLPFVELTVDYYDGVCKLREGQYVLAQVVKEGRGSKRAFFTSNITLVSSYCIFMPKTPNKTRISSNITKTSERERLSLLLKELNFVNGSVIIRTLAENNHYEDIKKDFNHLQKIWSQIIQQKSSALVYTDTDIIIRFLRDINKYNVSEVIVSGNKAYLAAQKFSTIILQDRKNFIYEYRQKKPIFAHYNIEEQLASLYNNVVTLHSGGYIVINPTEALVSIDVNSGKMTGEKNIEETAYKTNIEAAYEIARQVILRSLSGIIAIDFIDMSDEKNLQTVVLAAKEAFKADQARLKFLEINAFGVMMLSRQRIKQSVNEANTVACNCCNGFGVILTTEYLAISILRSLYFKIECMSCKAIVIHACKDIALYLLNDKRMYIQDIENTFNISILIQIDNSLPREEYHIEYSEYKKAGKPFLDQNTLQTETSDNKFWLTKWLRKIVRGLYN